MTATGRFIFTAILLSVIGSPAFAQWMPIGGLDGSNVATFTVSGTNLYAGMAEGRVYRSTDNGSTWVDVGHEGLQPSAVYAIAVTDEYLFAGTCLGRDLRGWDLSNAHRRLGMDCSQQRPGILGRPLRMGFFTPAGRACMQVPGAVSIVRLMTAKRGPDFHWPGRLMILTLVERGFLPGPLPVCSAPSTTA